MARLRDRAGEAAETRGELVLYKLDRPTETICALRGALYDAVDRSIGRGLDRALVQGMLPGDASLIRPRRNRIDADNLAGNGQPAAYPAHGQVRRRRCGCLRG